MQDRESSGGQGASCPAGEGAGHALGRGCLTTGLRRWSQTPSSDLQTRMDDGELTRRVTVSVRAQQESRSQGCRRQRDCGPVPDAPNQ